MNNKNQNQILLDNLIKLREEQKTLASILQNVIETINKSDKEKEKQLNE